MGKLKYHSEGIGKNKKIKAERNKPVPVELMRYEKPIGIRTNTDGDTENNWDCKNVPLFKNER